jgi:hypothetical protein
LFGNRGHDAGGVISGSAGSGNAYATAPAIRILTPRIDLAYSKIELLRRRPGKHIYRSPNPDVVTKQKTRQTLLGSPGKKEDEA